MFPLYDRLDVKVCRQHMEMFGMSNIFGFIAYTDRDPFIKKVLRDDDFWKCFHELSRGWIIYAIKPPKTGSYDCQSQLEDVFMRMIPIWKEPAANSEFIKSFGLDDTSRLPCFIAFGINEKGGFDRLIYPLKANSEEEAFTSIRKVIKIIAQTEKRILPEYKSSANVFREVAKQIEAAQFRENLPMVGRFLKEAFDLTKRITTL